jgi:hypothetical protein
VFTQSSVLVPRIGWPRRLIRQRKERDPVIGSLFLFAPFCVQGQPYVNRFNAQSKALTIPNLSDIPNSLSYDNEFGIVLCLRRIS